jgi:hypothetical protein
MADRKRAARITAAFILCAASLAGSALFQKSVVHWLLPPDGLGFAIVGFKMLRGSDTGDFDRKFKVLVTCTGYMCATLVLYYAAKRYGDVALPHWVLAISCLIFVVLAATVIRRGYRAIQT